MKTNTNSSQVVHSSLRLFNQPDLEFPQSDPRLGICVRIGYPKLNTKQMASIYYESPIVIAPGKGEDNIEIDEVEIKVRSLAIDISTQCRKLADELIKHASRLEELITSDNLLDINQEKLNDIKSVNDDKFILDDSENYKLLRQQEMSKSHEARNSDTSSISKSTNIERLKELVRQKREQEQR